MKLYKKGNYTAHETITGMFDIKKDSQPGIIESSHVSLDFLLDMGFEEVVEVPEWFKNIENEYDDFVYDESISVGAKLDDMQSLAKKYQIFLKHHSKQDTLPVEEIAKIITKALRENNGKFDINNVVADILRTYAIKDTSLVPLESHTIDGLMNVIEGNVYLEYLSGSNSTAPKIKVNKIAIKKVLSKYGTPKIT